MRTALFTAREALAVSFSLLICDFSATPIASLADGSHPKQCSPLIGGTKAFFIALTVSESIGTAEERMRAILVALAAISLLGPSGPAITKERVLLNCRLMTETDPWLFRQHCKSENFTRLAVPSLEGNKSKYHKKHAHKKDIYKKRHAFLKKLYWLRAELRECKSYKCKLIVKSKLAKLYSEPSYSTLGSTTNALSTRTNSLRGAVGSTVSGTTNAVGGAASSAGGIVSGATNTVGGVLK
jgi:hypothetical protein